MHLSWPLFPLLSEYWGKMGIKQGYFMDMYLNTALCTLIPYICSNCIQCCGTKCTKGLTQLWTTANLHFICKSTCITSIFYAQWNSFSCAFYSSVKAQFLTSSTHGSLLLKHLPREKKMDAYCFHFHLVFSLFFRFLFLFNNIYMYILVIEIIQ